ncbi:sodium/glutamate symporter [Aerococcaceae bacterium INB8]|uniref:Sodium/glutamate symporter n=1 Tax=Ruoffia halotolerans TaxID=2748684 RepID=A0A839A4F8_9LACT|nr:sodium/glutamate symporter [Ruoffia halotolerans]MBA5728710.1 sodium/glutamate symporter [Ruoffia halotolerans]
MEISLDLLQTVGLSIAVYMIGDYIKSKIGLLQKYFIPAPVIGGLLFSIILFIGYQTESFYVTMDITLQDFFMNVFFTTVGFTISAAIIKKSGKLGAILAVVSVFFLIIQNLIGVGISELFGIHKLLGVAMGSTSMSGGVGSAMAFGPTFESLGAEGATTVGAAAATFGLFMGSIVGGPVAKRLIDKYNLSSSVKNSNVGELLKEKDTDSNLFRTVMLVILTAALGSIISYVLNLTGLTFPYYVGCLFAGAIVRNLADAGMIKININEIDSIGNISLNIFLSMALMNLSIWTLLDLAGPMIVILITQTVVIMFYAYFVTFRTMGKNYDAAVMAAGHCGVALGQTPNAIANMSAIIDEHGTAPTAWFVLPIITVVFINIFNPIIITIFINLFS